MREINGELRGLLKKPNRPTPARKNRVVFDETRNEFFEADYIILIREDCSYDDEEEEPCTCGEHEFVRLCCEEGCQCNYTGNVNDDNRPPQQNPKFVPSIELLDEAALSPPDGYKDNGIKLTEALSGHIFGAQHIQQLQVIQRLQQQRAAMLAARSNKQQVPPPPPPVNCDVINHLYMQQQQQQQSHGINMSNVDANAGVCSECAECAECCANKTLDTASCPAPTELPPLAVPAVTFLPLHANSPERRITEKEIIAGEERPKYVIQSQKLASPDKRVIREPAEDITSITETKQFPSTKSSAGSVSENEQSILSSNSSKEASSPSYLSGILKGGKLWKQDSLAQSDDANNTTSEDESGVSVKRSVRFVTENEAKLEEASGLAGSEVDSENQINELIPIKKHSSLFNNVMRPNSAVRQLFPSAVQETATLTSEALRAFDESKRAGFLVPNLPGCSGDSDTLKRNVERGTLRRSLIK